MIKKTHQNLHDPDEMVVGGGWTVARWDVEGVVLSAGIDVGTSTRLPIMSR